MSFNSDASEIALEKIKNILIVFEKKKRNLEKRKNKLDEYKKKPNLNEDQQAAVAKYPEVMSNLELLEELTIYTVQQMKETEKYIKKIKKQEKIDKKRSEIHLIEFILKNYSVLERMGSNERIRNRLMIEGQIKEKELNYIMELVGKLNLSGKGDWKTCTEQMYALYENNVNVEIVSAEDKRSNSEELISCLNNLSKVDWLWATDVEEIAPNCIQIETQIEIPIIEESIKSNPLPIVEESAVEPEPVSPCIKPALDNPKLNFVFLHDSTVQNELSKAGVENGCGQSGVDLEVRPTSQTSANNLASTWQTESNTEFENVVDVFSSATQSEFMRTENAKNAWARGVRMTPDTRFKNRTNANISMGHNEGLSHDVNYRRPDRGAFNQNPRFSRQSRGRARGWGRHENQQMGDALPSQ